MRRRLPSMHIAAKLCYAAREVGSPSKRFTKPPAQGVGGTVRVFLCHVNGLLLIGSLHGTQHAPEYNIGSHEKGPEVLYLGLRTWEVGARIPCHEHHRASSVWKPTCKSEPPSPLGSSAR